MILSVSQDGKSKEALELERLLMRVYPMASLLLILLIFLPYLLLKVLMVA